MALCGRMREKRPLRALCHPPHFTIAAPRLANHPSQHNRLGRRVAAELSRPPPPPSWYPGRGHDGGALPPARPPPPLRGQPPPLPPHSSRVARRLAGHTRLEATSTVTAADASSRTTMLSDAAFHCHRRRRECVANAGLGAGSAAGHDAAAVVTVTQSGGTVPQPPSPPSTTGQRRPRLHDRCSA